MSHSIQGDIFAAVRKIQNKLTSGAGGSSLGGKKGDGDGPSDEAVQIAEIVKTLT